MDAPSVEFNNDVFVIADAFRRASVSSWRLPCGMRLFFARLLGLVAPVQERFVLAFRA